MVRGFASHLSCYPKLQKDLTLRLRLIQTRVLGNGRVAHQATGGTAEGQLQKEPSFNQDLHLRCALLALLPHLLPMRVNPLFLRALCEKHQSSLPASLLDARKALGPISHQLIITTASQIFFSARSHVLRSKCYSEFFKIIVFPLCTWRTKCSHDLYFLLNMLHFSIQDFAFKALIFFYLHLIICSILFPQFIFLTQ